MCLNEKPFAVEFHHLKSWKTSTHSLIQLSVLDVILLWCELCFLIFSFLFGLSFKCLAFYAFNFLFDEIISFLICIWHSNCKPRKEFHLLMFQIMFTRALESLNKTLIQKELCANPLDYGIKWFVQHTLQHYGFVIKSICYSTQQIERQKTVTHPLYILCTSANKKNKLH